MRRINRNIIRNPLDTSEVSNIIEEEKYKFQNLSEIQKKQYKHETRIKIFKKYKVKDILLELFNNKCAFCETIIGKDSAIEHFWPKSKYWEKIYSWDNLFACCYACNRSKGNRFPLSKNLKDKETPLLIDPCNDKIEISCNEDGILTGQSEKGYATIDTFALNRIDLIENRKNAINDIDFTLNLIKRNSNWKKIIKDFLDLNKIEKSEESLLNRISYLLNEKQPFILAKTDYLLKQINNFNIEKNDDTYAKIKTYDWIETVEIQNFKSIESLKIDFKEVKLNEYTQPCLGIIGENGVGKSSILEAIAITLMLKKDRDILISNASTYLAENKDEGSITITLSNTKEKNILEFHKNSKEFITNNNENTFIPILAYSSYRLPPNANDHNYQGSKYYSVENLFNPWIQLKDCEKTLTNTNLINEEYFIKIAIILKELLDLPSDSYFSREKQKVILNINNKKIEFSKLSDGYKSILTIIADIIYNWKLDVSQFEEFQGLILIDEIEVHLHPKWKIKIVDSLRKTFPNVTFILTTHDPLCLRGFESNEILFLKKDINHLTENKFISTPNGLSIEEILTGKWFNLDSTYDKNTVLLYEEYQELLIENPDSQRILVIEKILNKKIGMFSNSIEKIAHSVTAEIMHKNYEKYKNKFPKENKLELRKLILEETENKLRES